MIDVIADRIVRKNPFLRDWSNYGIIDIFNPVATAQYQHSVTIPWKFGMAHDFRDLRFFQADGTEIPFWNESKTDGSTSFNWFKPHSLSQLKAYVFYGNREAANQSNGDKTFDFFDDFLGSSLDATKWGGSSGATVSNGVLEIYATGGGFGWVVSKNQFSAPYIVTSRMKSTRNSGVNIPFGFNCHQQASTKYVGYTGTNGYRVNGGDTTFFGTNIQKYTGSWTTLDQDSYSYSTNTYYHMVLITQTSGNALTLQLWNDGRITKHAESSSTDSTYTSGYITLFVYYDSSGGTGTFDNIFVRKYTATEPVCQFNQSGLRNPGYK